MLAYAVPPIFCVQVCCVCAAIASVEYIERPLAWSIDLMPGTLKEGLKP